jgi:integrase
MSAVSSAVEFDALPEPLQALVRSYAAALACDPTKDQRYRATALGPSVESYLRWKENDDSAAASTLDSYERVLARLCARMDKLPEAVTTDDVRAVRDAFTRGQRRKATAVLKDFFKWLYEEELISSDPASRMRYPKRVETVIEGLFDDDEKRAIVAAQSDVMDRVGVLLLLRAGLRQAEMRNLRVRDVNLIERYIVVRRGKGDKPRTVPIKGELIRALEELFLTDVAGLSRARRSDEFLLCPKRGGGRALVRDPSRPMSKRGAHEWWYRCLQRAGVVEAGVTSGRRMHLSRHTYATDLGRATGWSVAAVSKNLGHKSGKTTMDLYWHLMIEDQMEAVARLPEIGGESSGSESAETRMVDGREAPTGVEPVYQVLQTCA